MSENAEKIMTNVKGYFNPNPYRVNVSISELGGLSVQLGPMEFIMERGTNKKINDPILDKYVGYKMLSPELSDKPVPVVPIPRMPSKVPSLHVVNQGVRGNDGKWQLPVNSQPVQQIVEAPSTVSRPSVTALTMDQARKMGFVGKAKLVAEDYGAPETDGAPTRGDAIPKIRYAMESQAPLARAAQGELPKELKEQIDPKLAPLIGGLQAAAQQDPEAVNLGRKAAEQAVATQQGAAGVQNFRQAVKAIKSRPKMPSATMPPPAQPTPSPVIKASATPPRRRVGQVLNAAAQPVTAVSAPPVEQVESPLVGGRPSDLPPPILEEVDQEAPVAPAPQPVTPPAGEIVCPVCSKKFPYMSYYKRHVMRSHKDRIAELFPQAG